MKKSIKAIFLIVVLAVSSAALVYFSIPNIHYYSYSTWVEYQKIGDQWHTINLENNTTVNGSFTTIYCKNNGLFAGTFHITVALTNATFSNNSSELFNIRTLNILYTLKPQEENITNVNFAIGNNVKAFAISISLQTDHQFIRYSEDNWAGQHDFFYFVAPNNTWVPTAIS
jgi:hypothetical protein